ncbi:MAG: type IX secretion system sortase PorU [Reichenbachiella sp.]|uniref:type IX secretion system sortase PorU n=1 Tax=Reichenbachiella sp. TaxID=2184521 RepID=UPI003263FB43
MKTYIHIVWIISLLVASALEVRSQASNSILSSGKWYKLAVLESGVYKIDHAMLSEMGINIDNIDPRKIAVYGNSFNGMLPQSNLEDRPDDLSENAILISGQSDGSFDRNDYLLFYGKSSDHLSFDMADNQFHFERNVYSDTAYYFLTIKKMSGKRIATTKIPTGNLPLTRTYSSFESHELEENSIIGSGRFWYGERFSSTNRNNQVSFSGQGIKDDTEIVIYTSVLSGSTASSSFDLDIDGFELGTIQMVPISDGTYVTKANTQIDTIRINSTDLNNSAELEINYRFNNSGTGSGYLDYVHVQSEKNLNLGNGSLFWSRRSGEQAYSVSGENETTLVWDISKPLDIVELQADLVGNNLAFAAPEDAERFLVFNQGQEQVPYYVGQVDGQNLHGLSPADGIIITYSDFLTSAESLAAFRSKHDGLQVEVVTVDQIYNEFSSGAQDVTAIRDFIKFQYDKYGQLKYVLLFGDCSFDFKDRSIASTNFVPVYESRNSLHKLWSYSSDDYFGFLESEEGDWFESQGGDHTMEIGVGRIPIQTNQEGEDVVNKIIRYQTNKLAFGKWRNKITFVADDGDNNIHQQDANKMATYVDTTRSELNVNKLFLDAFEQNQNESTKASEAFIDAFSQGNLIVNFTGHGNEGQLTHEDIFNEFMIPKLNNNIIMPLFITATCQFGNYDDPNRISGGEQVVLLPYGGAVALITATRPVFSNTNYKLNEAFYFSAMQKSEGLYKRLGDMMRETKNNSLVGIGNRNYALLGDPMMRISFPEQTVKLTAINGKSLDQLDTLKAFGTYAISGEIQSNEEVLSNFDGSVAMTVFDKPSAFRTLGDESSSEVYQQRDVLLFQGQATVSKGTFNIDFIVPKNINYSFGEGKINFYAVNDTTGSDAHGSYSEVIVGGSEKINSNDTSPPEIDIFLNDTTFQSGQIVGPSPLLLVKLEDESGINISNAGFGNELTLIIDDEEAISLNEYYSASMDTYQEGWVSYPLDDIGVGRHSMTIEASDIFNNVSRQSADFIVTQENGIKLTEIENYPNPILPNMSQTTIAFTHDRLGEDLRVLLTITDMQGHEILTNTYRFDNVSEERLEINWNLDNSGAGRVRKGIYIYRLKVQSRVDESSGEAFRRIVVLN